MDILFLCRRFHMQLRMTVLAKFGVMIHALKLWRGRIENPCWMTGLLISFCILGQFGVSVHLGKYFCLLNDCLRCVLDQCLQPMVACLMFGMVMHCYISLHSFIWTILCLGPDDVSGGYLEHVRTMVHYGSKSDSGSIHLLWQSSTSLEWYDYFTLVNPMWPSGPCSCIHSGTPCSASECVT